MCLSVLTWRCFWVVETCCRKHYRKYSCVHCSFYFIASYFGVYHFWTNAWVTQELFQKWHERRMERVWTVGLLIRRCNRLSGWKSATTKENVTIVFVFCNPRLNNEVTNSLEKWRGERENSNDRAITSPWCHLRRRKTAICGIYDGHQDPKGVQALKWSTRT